MFTALKCSRATAAAAGACDDELQLPSGQRMIRGEGGRQLGGWWGSVVVH